MDHHIKPLPSIDSVWKHRTGNLYRVTAITNLESVKDDFPVTVVYKGMDGSLWSKPAKDWHMKMTEVCGGIDIKVRE